MNTSYTASQTTSFTVIHARHMATKVAADLKRLQRFYSKPTDQQIANYEAEAVALLKDGLLGEVTYGFRRNGDWVEPALRYTAEDLSGSSSSDDDPGRIRPGVDITGATFYSFLTFSAKWDRMTQAEKQAAELTLPFVRGGAAEPGITGYLSKDHTYSAGGRALNRFTVKSY